MLTYILIKMLPVIIIPAFKNTAIFVGNYGGAWWNQINDFETFNGVSVHNKLASFLQGKTLLMVTEYILQALQVLKVLNILRIGKTDYQKISLS